MTDAPDQRSFFRTLGSRARSDIARRLEEVKNRIAYVWALWGACWALLARHRGVAAEARRQLWQSVRARASVSAHVNARWAPWWLGTARRFPVHSVLFVVLFALTLLILVANMGAGLPMCRSEASTCREALVGLVSVVLSAQATLLAVIFPLAVALVTLLASNGGQRQPRLRIFFDDTELMAAGVFAILLVAACSCILLLQVMFSSNLLYESGILLSIWFVVNLAGIGFFLWRGVHFVMPEGRHKALRRQIASRYWPEEVVPKIADVLLLEAITPNATGWSERYRLWQMRTSDGRQTVSVRLTAPSRLVEVRHLVLRAVARALARRAPDIADPAIMFLGPPAQTIGALYKNSMTVAKATIPLMTIERWLIGRSYMFLPRTTNETLTCEHFLGELVGDLLRDLRGHDWPSFKDRLDEISSLHGFILRLSARHHPDGRRGSYAVELHGSWFNNVAGTWARCLLPLYEEVAGRLPDTGPAFRQVAYLPIHLALEAGDTTLPAALVETDRHLAGLAYRLFERGVAVAGSPEHRGVAAAPVSIPPTAFAWYDDAWKTLSAAWERLASQRAPDVREEASPAARWVTCIEHWQALEAHLAYTTDIVAYAAVLGELRGGRRALDLLLRWPINFPEAGASASWVLQPGSVPPSVLRQSDWATATSTASILDNEWSVDPKALFYAAVWNAWADECLALALILIDWAKEAGTASPCAELANWLVHRRLLDQPSIPGEGGYTVEPFNARWLLRTVASAVAGTVSPHCQERGLGNRIERLRRLSERHMVSGRVYVGHGLSDRIEERTASLAPLLIALALRDATIAAWPTTPAELGLGNASLADEAIAGFFNTLAEAADTLSDPASLNLLRQLAGRQDITDERIGDIRNDVVRVCQQIAAAFRNRRKTSLREADVDPTRLAAIARAAESLAFTKDRAGPPVSLFATARRRLGEQPVRFGVRIAHSRGSLTSPLLEQPVSNETDWWAQTMRDHVAASVCRHIADRAGQHTQVENPEAWRDTLVDWLRRIREAGSKPVVLFGRDWPGRWALTSQLGQAILERLNRAEPREWSRTRTPFLDDVRVERLAVLAPTLVIPDDCFREIVFGEDPDKRIVTVDFAPSTDDPTQGLLTAQGTFDTDFARLDLALVLQVLDEPG